MEYATLNNAIKMPMEGFGVFQVRDKEECKRSVLDAIKAGYRLIDTAASYTNEDAVGEAVKEAIAQGICTREELFITSKMWVQDMQNYETAKAAIDASLSAMGLEYLDLYLLHQAMKDYFSAWRAMEDAYKEGKLRAIGVSNFYPHTLTCFSYSKSLSLPGERLGYVAVRPGCEGEDVLVDMMAQISRFTGHNCPPSIIQRAVSRCQDVTSDLSVYETNMNLLYDKLTALGFEVERPGGTFYIFPKALEEDANAFCMKAREFDLLLVPSDSFGVKGYVRLAYCIDTEKVKRSLPALEKLAAAYRK